jgi:2-epi-5-epi-valiolone synthase
MTTATCSPQLGVFETHYGWRIRADDGISYQVANVPDLLGTGSDVIQRIDPELAERAATRKWLVFVDSNVDSIYGSRIRSWLQRQPHRELEVVPIVLRESDKNLSMLDQLVSVLVRAKLRHSDQLVVIGGGVLSDLVGLLASMWRKGVALWVIPTTLIGAVDAGIAIKRAANYFLLSAKFKNLLGYYYEPELVLIAPEWWVTTATEDVSSAAAEMFKVGCVVDPELVDLLESHGRDLVSHAFQPSHPRTGKAADAAVRATIAGTLRELQRDERERERRRKLDFGHNFGGALEMVALDRLPHGWGVGIDMCWSAALASQLERDGKPLLDTSKRDRMFRVIGDLGVPTTHELLTPELIADALAGIALHRDGEQNLPLLFRDFGHVTWVSDITPEQSAAALDTQNRLSRRLVVA